jgi:hypothetical protein
MKHIGKSDTRVARIIDGLLPRADPADCFDTELSVFFGIDQPFEKVCGPDVSNVRQPTYGESRVTFPKKESPAIAKGCRQVLMIQGVLKDGFHFAWESSAEIT